jgi:hypothetical protein
MSSRGVSSRVLAPLASLALACAFPALADDEPTAQTRATIRGTGNDVSIVYKGVAEKAPKRGTAAAPRVSGGANGTAPLGGARPAQPDLLGEATRMAEHGAGRSVAHQLFSDPPVAPRHRRQRRGAQARRPELAAVVTYLSHLSAVDIGETAEWSPQQYAYANPGEAPPGYAS